MATDSVHVACLVSDVPRSSCAAAAAAAAAPRSLALLFLRSFFHPPKSLSVVAADQSHLSSHSRRETRSRTDGVLLSLTLTLYAVLALPVSDMLLQKGQSEAAIMICSSWKLHFTYSLIQ